MAEEQVESPAGPTTVSEPVVSEKTAERRSDGYVIRYSLESSCDYPVNVTVEDPIDIGEPADLGFEPEHTPEEWVWRNGAIRFRTQLEANGHDRNVLGIITEEEPDSIDPVDGTSTVIDVVGVFESEESDAFKTSPTDSGLEQDPGAGDVEQDPEWGESETDWAEPANEFEQPESQMWEPEQAELRPATLISILLEALDSDEVAEKDLEQLREAFESGPSRSEEVRLEHMQARIEELDAYVDMLSSFIDEQGTLSEFAEHRREQTAKVTERLDSIESTLDSLDERVTEINKTLADQDESVADLEAQVEALENSLESIEPTIDRFDRVESALADALDHRPNEPPEGSP